MNKTMYSYKKWSHILLHLFVDINSSTLKHITAIATHWNELGSQLLSNQTPKCDHGNEHQMKNVFSCPYTFTFSTQAKSGICFQPWTINKCKEIQDVLSIAITSLMLIDIKFPTSFWVDSNNNATIKCGCSSLVLVH